MYTVNSWDTSNGYGSSIDHVWFLGEEHALAFYFKRSLSEHYIVLKSDFRASLLTGVDLKYLYGKQFTSYHHLETDINYAKVYLFKKDKLWGDEDVWIAGCQAFLHRDYQILLQWIKTREDAGFAH